MNTATSPMLQHYSQHQKNEHEQRPKIKLALTTTDKIVEIISWIALITIWVMTVTNYSDLPETIPTHFNGAGRADGFGGKGTILTLPLIATVLFIGLTILNKFPLIFNYPATITSDTKPPSR